jgi:ribosomal protein L11 methyltransferase
MSDFVEVRGSIPEALQEDLAAELSGLAVLGVQIEQVEPGQADVSVWVSADDAALLETTREVLRGLGSDATECVPTPAHDWSAGWRDNLVAFEVGRRWWIDPRPDGAGGVPDGRLGIAVVPRAAFGSGTHESTQLVLMDLEDVGCDGLVVLDVGTGSGVLAVAADRLGADAVVALDIDPVAVWEARSTAARQTWSCRPLIAAGSVDCIAGTTFDLIVCNMILTHFEPMLVGMRRVLAPGGTLILSGILESERRAVQELLAGTGMAAAGQRRFGEWISIRARHRGEA